ncbi:rna-directed dna polymerase from mobile element jockey-like [Pitangus sulphuratus]|nr:rna-directed dna polymerase from mobile element jockey-like [Pitangus sulphuratus]
MPMCAERLGPGEGAREGSCSDMTFSNTDAIQRIDRIEKWTHADLTKLDKPKCKVLHMDWEQWIESSPRERDLEILVDEKLEVTQ